MSEIVGWFAPDETRELVVQARDTIADTDAKVDELVVLLRNQAAAAGMDLNLESEAAIRNAVEAIVVSSNRKKQTALTRLEEADVSGAAGMMKELAVSPSSAASATVETAVRRRRRVLDRKKERRPGSGRFGSPRDGSAPAGQRRA